MPVSTAEASAAAHRAGARFTALLRSGFDPGVPLPASTWTVGDVAAHVASGARAYREIVAGRPSVYTDLDDRAATNESLLAAESVRDLDALAATIDDELGAVLADVASLSDDALLTWHGGIPLPARVTLGAIVGELVFHGHDIARAVSASWPIERRDALPIVDFFNAATPHVVDAEAARDVSRTFEVRVRGHDTSTFAFRDGALTVTPGRAERPDVRMSADPVAFLLVGYGRSGLARPVLAGKLLAWGRRPWLAFGFADLFQAP